LVRALRVKLRFDSAVLFLPTPTESSFSFNYRKAGPSRTCGGSAIGHRHGIYFRRGVRQANGVRVTGPQPQQRRLLASISFSSATTISAIVIANVANVANAQYRNVKRGIPSILILQHHHLLLLPISTLPAAFKCAPLSTSGSCAHLFSPIFPVILILLYSTA
jgi:hypothetical protein